MLFSLSSLGRVLLAYYTSLKKQAVFPQFPLKRSTVEQMSSHFFPSFYFSKILGLTSEVTPVAPRVVLCVCFEGKTRHELVVIALCSLFRESKDRCMFTQPKRA